jgi:hypothetical protein
LYVGSSTYLYGYSGVSWKLEIPVVGIGKAPSYNLDVSGNIQATNNLYVSGKIGVGTTSPSVFFGYIRWKC